MAIFMTSQVFAQENNNNDVEAGYTPEDKLYFFDNLVEKIDLAFTFNKKLIAKKYIYYAYERSKEIEKVKKVENIELLQEKLENNLKLALKYDSDIKDKVEKVKNSNENILKNKLEKIKTKSIAINKLTTEFEVIEEYSDIFEEMDLNGKIVKLQVDNIDYYYLYKDSFVYLISEIEFDYEIKILDEEKANELYNNYIKGENVIYSDFNGVVEIPLELKSKFVYFLSKKYLKDNLN